MWVTLMSDDLLVRLVLSLQAEVAALRRSIQGAQRVGTVHDVDTDKRRVQIKLADNDGSPFLAPWRPWAETAGAEMSWRPPSKGQQMMLLSPFGDMRQGVAIPLTYSNANPAPSNDPDQRILSQFGSSLLAFNEGGGSASLFSDRVDLGGEDGRRVARIGDRVQVSHGDSAGLWPIVEGSEKVFAA